MRKKRGIATYLSWASKIIASFYALGAGVGWWSSERSGSDIILISGGILAPFLPIDVSKVRQSMIKEPANETSNIPERKE